MNAPLIVDRLTKNYGRRRVLDAVSFTASPGRITGFLGPNGSGKTTTVRIALGLAKADAGTVTIAGERYQALPHPAATVGVLLEDAGLHPSLTPMQHLKIAAASTGTRRERITEIIDEMGLADAAKRRVRGFSQGMRQRLGLALALLTEPEVLVLDEPANGLDPEGMIWLRSLLTGYARAGAIVLVTSHVLNELERFLDDIVIIDHGKVATQARLDEIPGEDLEAFYLDTLRGATQEAS